MNFFKELLNNITNNVNDSIKSDSELPNLVTILCINSTGSRKELIRLIQKHASSDQITPQIEEFLNNLSIRNEITDIFKQFNPKFNRIYGKTYLENEPEIEQFKPTIFTSPLIYSGYPYYCPNGWRRYSMYVDDIKQYEDWPVAYHGTASKNLLSILDEGLRPSNKKNGKHCAVFGDGFYFSPSIEYCANPRYAEIKKSQTKGFYIQTILQCRVKPNSFKINRETLLRDKTIKIDPNFKNSELEWLIPLDYVNNSRKNAETFFIIYGIMARLTNENPEDLPINEWWKY